MKLNKFIPAAGMALVVAAAVGGIVMLAGTPRVEMSAEMKEEALRPLVGRRIIVTGIWNDREEDMARCVRGPTWHQGAKIFFGGRDDTLPPEKFVEFIRAVDGSPVTVEGVLRFWKPPEGGPHGMQEAGPHFYFDLNEARLTFAEDPGPAVIPRMRFRDAETALKGAGAKETEIDAIDTTGPVYYKAYALADGRLLSMTVSKSDDRVSGLELCENPAKPKANRTWRNVMCVRLAKK